MSPELDDERSLYEKIFFPVAHRRRIAAIESGLRFAYYTSASTASSIIANEEVWLRNARLMNDYSEVNYGQDCLFRTWKDKIVSAELTILFEKIGPNVKQMIEQMFDNDQGVRVLDTYMLCISEHDSATLQEDRYGRLSMWRAYGGDTNVALVLNNAPFFSEADELMAFTSPVEYGDHQRFHELFLEFLEGMKSNIDLLRDKFDEDTFAAGFINSLMFMVLSFKHPAFAEEREWRIIYRPTSGPSKHIRCDIHTVAGIPQIIQKIGLKNIPEIGFEGASIPEIFERLIIGPTPEPYPMVAAFNSLLTEAGVENAVKKIVVSGVPLRR